MKPPSPPAGPRRLGPLITRVARRSAGRRGLPTAEILTNWRSIVGAELAPLTVPMQVTFPRGAGDGGTLKLRVAAGFGPIVAQQEPSIVARLNTYFGYGAIARLRLVQGPPLTSAVLATARDESPAGHDSIAESGGNPPCDSASDSDRLPALERLRRALAARGQGPAGRQKA